MFQQLLLEHWLPLEEPTTSTPPREAFWPNRSRTSGRASRGLPHSTSFVCLSGSILECELTVVYVRLVLFRQEFTNLTLSKVEPYNHNTNTYTFKFDDPNAICGGPITHLLMVRAAEDGAVVDAKGKDIARPYTPISSASHVGEVVLLIKKYDVCWPLRF